jgi:hypothetical protein
MRRIFAIILCLLERTNPLHSPNLHSNLAAQPGHSCAQSSLEAPDIANYSTAASSQLSARSSFCTDRSGVEASKSRRRRRYEGGVLEKTVWRRWMKEF